MINGKRFRQLTLSGNRWRVRSQVFRGYFPQQITLEDKDLTRIYTLDVANSVVAAGGHQGYITLWDLNFNQECKQGQEHELDSMLSFKGHDVSKPSKCRMGETFALTMSLR